MPINLQYDFNCPYDGGSQLAVENTGDAEASITTLSFTVNAHMTGSPWGTLWVEGSKIATQENPDKTITYAISYSKPLIIKPNQALVMSYAYDGISGALPLAMDPAQVSAVTTDSKLIPLLIKGHCEGADCKDPTPGKRVAVYVANWDIYVRNFWPKDLPIRYTNKWLYAFFNFDVNGNIKMFDPNADRQLLPKISIIRKRYPHLDVALSVGGWTLSENFSPMAANPAARANFVKQAVAVMKLTGMNGVDIDWEYPIVRFGRPGDAKNFAALLTELRKALDEQARQDQVQTGKAVHYQLSIAAPAGLDKMQALEKDYPAVWKEIEAACDEVNLMTYDMHGAFDEGGPSDHQSPMKTDPRSPYSKSEIAKSYNYEAAIEAMIARGFPRRKINGGKPIYFRSSLVNTLGSTDGLWQTVTGTPPGQFDATGMFDYKCVVARDCKGGKTPPADFRLIPAADNPRANVSQVPWGVSASAGQVFTGDDVASVRTKAQYNIRNGLGGSMFWLGSGDFNASDSRSLIGTVARVYQANATTSSSAPAMSHDRSLALDLLNGTLNAVTTISAQYMLILAVEKMAGNFTNWLGSFKAETIDIERDRALDFLVGRAETAYKRLRDRTPFKESYENLMDSYADLLAKRYLSSEDRARYLDQVSHFLTGIGNITRSEAHARTVSTHAHGARISAFGSGIFSIRESERSVLPVSLPPISGPSDVRSLRQ